MTTSTTEVRTYTPAEVAEILHVDRETVYRWARATPPKIGFCPKLPGQRYYRFRQQHIDDFLNGVAPTETAPKAAKPSRRPKYALNN